MKKKKIWVLMLAMLALLAGCSSAETAQSESPLGSTPTLTEEMQPASKVEGEKVLIAYFSRIGNIDDEYPVDAISSASVVMQGDEMLGNVQYMATLIQNETGGTLHFIETAEKYPSEYDSTDNNALDIQAEREANDNARPALATHIDNIAAYDVIFLGFPTWYGDMPMAIYTFLDEYDLADKQIYLFNTSGGSGSRNAYAEVERLEPEANVENNILSVSHSQVAALTELDVKQWLVDVGFTGQGLQ